jgi:hypothetical protein
MTTSESVALFRTARPGAPPLERLSSRRYQGQLVLPPGAVDSFHTSVFC